MDKVHAACDNLFTEVDHLDRIVDEDMDAVGIGLALSVAKRVQRTSRLVVQALAQERDNTATAQEAQAHDRSN
jgi:hypothetical protein